MRIEQVVFAQAVNLPGEKGVVLESSVRPHEPKWKGNLLAESHDGFISFTYKNNPLGVRVYATNIKYLTWSEDEQQASEENTQIESSNRETGNLSNQSNPKSKGKGKNSGVIAH